MNFDSSILQVPIEDIIPNRFQPRSVFDSSSLDELTNSIKQYGIIQPLVLRKVDDKYEIVSGERRYRAAKLAGLISVPAVISHLNDKQSAEVAIAENVHRSELSDIEEAKSYKALLDQGFMTKEILAKKMGITQIALDNKLKLLTLDETVQQAVLDHKISDRHARALLIVPDHNQQRVWLEKIINNRLNVKDLNDELRKEYNNSMNSEINNMINNAKDIPIENNIENNPFPQGIGTINLGESRPQGKFFNSLEDEAANMQMTEAVNPFFNPSPIVSTPTSFFTEATPSNMTPEPTSVIPNISAPEEIDQLDVAPISTTSSPITPIPTTSSTIDPISASSSAIDSIPNISSVSNLSNKDFSRAKIRIEDAISLLQTNDFNVTSRLEENNNELVYTIKIN